MWPASGARLPVIRLNAVVLPAPLPPIRLVIVPAFTSNDRSLTACKPPNDLDSASSLRIVLPAITAPSLQHVAVLADQSLTAIPGEEHEEQSVEHLAKLRCDCVGNREELECLGQQDEHRRRQYR